MKTELAALARRAGSRIEWLVIDEGLGSQDVYISDGSLIFPAALSEGSKSGISYLTARAVTDGSVVNAERGDRDE